MESSRPVRDMSVQPFTLWRVTSVFDRLTGQTAIADDLRSAARAARGLANRLDEGDVGAVSMFADTAEQADDVYDAASRLSLIHI